MTIERTPMSSSVEAALRLLGFSNAGTPLEMASTPVSAAQPEEKARSSRKAAAMPTTPCPGLGDQLVLRALRHGRGCR